MREKENGYEEGCTRGAKIYARPAMAGFLFISSSYTAFATTL